MLEHKCFKAIMKNISKGLCFQRASEAYCDKSTIIGRCLYAGSKNSVDVQLHTLSRRITKAEEGGGRTLI